MSEIDDFLEMEKDRELLEDPMLTEAEKALGETSIPDIETISEFDDFSEAEKLEGELANERISRIIEDSKNEKPENATKILKLARESGLPVDFVSMDPEGVERAIKTRETLDLLATSPILKDSAEDLGPYVDYEDFKNLSIFEQLHRDASAGLNRGMATRELGLTRRKLMEGFLAKELTEPEKVELRNRIKEIQTQLRQHSGGSGGFVEAAANIVGTFIEGVPQVLEAGAISGASAALGSTLTGPLSPAIIGTAASVGAAIELYRQSSGLEGGLIAQDLIDAGVEKNIANDVGEVSGNLAGLLEVYGAKLIASPFKDFIKKRFLDNVKREILKQTAKKSKLVAGAKTFGKTVAGETATEVGQELIGIAGVETGKTLSKKEFEPITMGEIQHQVGEIFKETLKGMTILAIPGATISMYNQKKSADQAVANQEYLRSMGENVQASKLKQRDGETHKEFSKRVHEGTAVDNVYIEAEKLQEVFQDDTTLLMEEIGAADQFEDALARKSDIIVPFSVYTDKIAGDIDAHNKIMPHVKFDEGGLTAFRAEELVKDEAMFRQKADRILKEQASDTEFIVAAEQVFRGVREQLVATGRFNDETADNYASLHQAFSVVKAKRLGITPTEVYEMFGLKIRQGDQVSDQQTLDQAAEEVKAEPGFDSFIEGSQVVDEAGEPLVVYHGTGADIESFDISKQTVDAKLGKGFYFSAQTNLPNLAAKISERRGGSPNVMPVYLSLKNPKVFEDSADLPATTLDSDRLKDMGHDGVIVKKNGLIWEIAVFEPNQIKSIHAKKFDPESPNILDQAARREGLYSAVEQAIDDMRIPAWKKENGEANGKDIWGKLKTLPGIKKEELKWTGIEEFLTGNPKAKFTREEVAQFARNNGVNLETVVAGEGRSGFEGLEGVTEIAWTSQRVWDDEEAWSHIIEDAEHNEIKARAVRAIMDQTAYTLPEEIKNDPNYNVEMEEKWIEENYEAEIEEQVEAMAREMYMDDPMYIVESMDDEIGLSLFGNDSMGWDIRRGGWQQHGNSVYNEPIYSLNEAKIQAREYAVQEGLLRGEDDVTVRRWEGYTMPGQGLPQPGKSDFENYREIKLTLPDIEGDFYEEAHFPDRNLVAFLRVDDRDLKTGEVREVERDVKTRESILPGNKTTYILDITSDGELQTTHYESAEDRQRAIDGIDSFMVQSVEVKKDTYFIEEFQSDWHQEGRQKGYRTGKTREEIASDTAKREIANDKVTQPLVDLFEGRFVRKPEDGWDDLKLKVPNEIHRANTSGTVWRSLSEDEKSLSIGGSDFISIGYEVLRKGFNWKPAASEFPATNSKYEFVANLIKDKFDEAEIDKLQDYVAEYDTLYKKVKAEERGVPDVPFKGDSWISLGLKRAIIDAVDGGYGAIAWANSETLVDRWSDQYRTLYQNQYDKKMPSIVKKLTGQTATHMHIEGYPMAEEGGFTDRGYHIIPITPELREKVQKEGFTLFQDDVAKANVKTDWYYSQLTESFLALPDNKTQPKSAKGWKQIIKKLGIKNKELEWTGIFEWLDTQTKEAQVQDLEAAIERRGKKRDQYPKGSDSYNLIDSDIKSLDGQLAELKAGKGWKVTKSQITNFLFNNGVKIETVEIDSKIGQVPYWDDDEFTNQVNWVHEDLLEMEITAKIDIMVQDEIFRLADKDGKVGEPVAITRKRIEDEHLEAVKEEVYDFNSEINERLRDRALEDVHREFENREPPEPAEIGADLTDYTFPGGEDESSLLLKAEQDHPRIKQEKNIVLKLWEHAIHIYGTKDYEPGYGDLLRFPTWQTYVQDKDLKFLPGHKDAKDVFTKEEERYFDENRLRLQRMYPRGPIGNFAPKFASHVFPQHGNIITWIRKQTRENFGQKILFIDEIQSDFEAAVRRGDTKAEAPFTDSQSAYVGLAIKKIITYAIENDFDRIEWTTGAQQSERYKSSLVNTVARIKYNPTTKQLSVVKTEDFVAVDRLGYHWTDVGKVEQKNLPGMVGKDVARTLLEEPLKDGTHLIEAGNVKISDKGMVDFYDRLIPDVASKMIKSLTGEKITIEYEDPTPGAYDAEKQPGFDLDKIRASFEGSRPSVALFQEKRGSFQFAEDITKDDSVINLFEAADLSTFLHESGHFFFEATRHLANQPDSPQQIKDDMNTLLSFVGVDDIDKWNKMSLEERREGHERVARAFEAYLFEGKAPSADLKNMFRRFRSWLIALYKNLTQLKVNLSDDVRGVFDRMLATDEEIRLTKESEDFQPLWDSRETAGMSQEEWANYQKQVSEEEEEADELLQTRALRDMRYMEGARGKVLSDLQRVQRERRTGVKKAVSIEVANQPVYKAKQFLRTPVEKRPTVKSNPNVVDPTRDSLFTAIAKLGGIDRAEAVAMWGIDPTDKFTATGVGNNPVVRATKGIDLDMMAEKLAELDYLPTDDHGKWDLLDLEERFMDEHIGNKRFSSKNDEFDFSEAYENFLAEEEGFVYIDKESGGKLALQPLIDEYGNGEDAIWRQLPLKGRYAMVTDEDHGFAPNLVAEEFGFGSGDEMIQALVAAPDMRVAVEEETDARMLELYGDLNTPTARARAITEALHGDLRTRVLHTEMKVLAKKVGSGNVLASTAKGYAKDKIARMTIMDIRPNDYLAAERRANRNAEKAIGQGRIDLAADHKRAAILNHHFAKEATKALGEVDRALRYFNQLDGKSARQRVGPEASEQIDRILNRYDLRKSVTNREIEQQQILSKWIEGEVEKGNIPVIPENLKDETRKVHYRTIPVEELRGLRDAVKNMDHLGSTETKLVSEQAKADLNAVASEIGNSIIKHNQKKKSKSTIKKLSKNLPQDQFGKANVGYFAEHRKLANLGREGDGFEEGGPFWEHIIRPMNARADWEAERKEEATTELGALFDTYKGTEFTYLPTETLDRLLPDQRLYARKFIPSIPDGEGGMGLSLSKMERIMVALNWGNEDNRNRVRDGFGWANEHVETVLDGLDARDWNFVQKVWDFIEGYWPEIEAKEKRVSGIAPEKVEALPVITKFGQFRGGYFPITFDKDLSQQAHGQREADIIDKAKKGALGRATTRRGHTKARMDAAGEKPIRLDFGVIFEHVDQVIHDLAWHEFLVNTNKLINHKSTIDPSESLPNIIHRYMGPDKFGAIKNTLRDIAAGDVQGVQFHEKAFNYLRAGVSISAMGWNLGTALLQPFGVTQGMQRVGPKWVMKALLRFYSGAAKMDGSIKEMFEQSSFLRLRSKTMNREINEIRNKVGGAGLFTQAQRSTFRKLGIPVDSMADTYFWLIAKAQLLADAPVWLGAKEKALAEGRDLETAIALADQAVIDSQGSGHIKDLAGVQRGNPIKKLFTNFMSYFQTTYNLTIDAKNRFIRAPLGPKSLGRLAVDMFLLYTAPILMTWYLREAALKGECDHGADTKCVFDKLGREHVGYALGGLLGLRELNSAAQGYFGYEGPAGTRFFSDAARLSQQLQKDDIDAEKLLKAGNRFFGILFHYPAGQMEKTVTGYLDLQAGKTNIPTAPLFGYSKE